MPKPNTAALDFLNTRRSRPAKTLTTPVPDRAQVEAMLTIAARSPDHGKLEPWRFVVLGREALLRMADLVHTRGAELGRDDVDIDKQHSQYRDAHLAVAVIEVPRQSDKIPLIEQTYSTGAVCLALLNAALASGWGANWLSGWAAHDRDFCAKALNLGADERVAGIIHIGTETSRPPERPRPDIAAITTWLDK